jgi:hypothetical protein
MEEYWLWTQHGILPLETINNVTIDPLADWLENIAYREIPKDQLWYLPPEQHAAELIIFNIIFLSLLYGNYYILYRIQSYSLLHIATIKSGKKLDNIPIKDIPTKRSLSWMTQLCRAILTACYLVTIWHKYWGNKLSMLMMPCHWTTICYLLALVSQYII